MHRASRSGSEPRQRSKSESYAPRTFNKNPTRFLTKPCYLFCRSLFSSRNPRLISHRSNQLNSILATTPDTKATGIIHKAVMPKISAKAISTATSMENSPPATVPREVAHGTNRAIKKSTNSGATTKLTTFITTSSRLPLT